MLKSIILFFAFVPLFLGCSEVIDNNSNVDDKKDKVKNYDTLANLDAKQAIDLSNLWRDTDPNVKTHITNSEVIFEFPDSNVVRKSLPDSLMFIAVAPYIAQTHECSIHYPSICSGELSEKTVKLTAIDDNGTIYIDWNVTTTKHGFIELWLPRNRNIKLSITYHSLFGEQIIQTNSDSRTCIPNFKLM